MGHPTWLGATILFGPEWKKFSHFVCSWSAFAIHWHSICHIISYGIQYAVAKLPFRIKFILLERPIWFRYCNIRREAFKDLFKVIDSSTNSQQARNIPLPFKKASTTCWLIHGKIMYNILVNWEELKIYYISAEIAETKFDTKYKATMLKKMLLDHKMKLLWIQEFQRLNCLFQKSKTDP